MSRPRTISRLIPLLVLLALPVVEAQAKKPRFGWQNFTARFIGGYSIGGTVGAAAGPAKIRIHAAKNGRSARVSWRNTFYDATGSHVVTMRWNFRPDGTVSVSTIDPRTPSLPAAGTFQLVANHPVAFTVTNAATGLTSTGKFRLRGGGALEITAVLGGGAEGDVPIGFSGGRVR
jgi:hypothetical protein